MAKKNYKQFLNPALFLAVVLVYLFISAPPPLVSDVVIKPIRIELALQILNQENNLVRALYTKEIVGNGLKVGIKFDENWRDEHVHAGLLPAQFLRESATYIERNRVTLGLFLGSDFAINKANLFEGQQKEMFEKMRIDNKPVFFKDNDTGRFTYMFPDTAVVKACVKCHNNHADSPKTDWKINDIMGATTWTYPQSEISTDTFLEMLDTLRRGFEYAYSQLIHEASHMNPRPMIGTHWPDQGFFLPNQNVFLDRLYKKTSSNTLSQLIALSSKHKFPGINPDRTKHLTQTDNQQ